MTLGMRPGPESNLEPLHYQTSALPRVPTESGNLEDESGYKKVMEHEKLTKSHGILKSNSTDVALDFFFKIVPFLQ